MRTMAKTTDDVLADLKRVGAVGAPPPPPVPFVVEVEKGVPESIEPVDSRGAESVEAIDAAISGLDDAVRGLEGAREALVRLRRTWEPSEDRTKAPVEAPEASLSASKASEAHPVAAEPQRPPEPSHEPQEVDEETLARAREAARRKILGEDLPPEKRAAMEEEDDVPFVGQDRALPPGMEPEEITIGTVGTIKPSFPAEE